MFPLHRQPLKGLYLTYRILILPPLYLYWTLTNLLPSQRPFPRWPLSRALGTQLIRWATGTFFNGNGLPKRDLTREPSASELRKLGEQGARFVWIEPVVMGDVKGRVAQWALEAGVEPARVQAFWIGEEGREGGAKDAFRDSPAAAQRPSKGRVMLFFHGGSYITGGALPTDLTSYLPTRTVARCSTLRSALLVDYRLSTTFPNPPSNPFPAALIDALAAFRYLLSLGYTAADIIVAGDSAGGNLALALTRYLVEEDGTGAQLAGLVLLSPWCDLSTSHHSPTCSLMRNYKTDYLLGPNYRMGEYSVQAFCGSLPAENAYISPACLDLPAEDQKYDAWPRCYLLAGGSEMIIDEIRTLAERMQRGLGNAPGSRFAYDEAAECPHDFCGMWFMEPERTEALKRICAWIDADDGAPGLGDDVVQSGA